MAFLSLPRTPKMPSLEAFRERGFCRNEVVGGGQIPMPILEGSKSLEAFREVSEGGVKRAQKDTKKGGVENIDDYKRRPK